MIRFEQVSKRYSNGQDALKQVSFHLQSGEMSFLTGHSGAGKSTLLKIILGLIHPKNGTIQVFNRPPEKARHLIGYVPQHARMDDTFPISVMDVVLIGRLKKAPLTGRYRKSYRRWPDDGKSTYFT